MFIQAVEEMEKYLQDKILNLPQSNSQVYIYYVACKHDIL